MFHRSRDQPTCMLDYSQKKMVEIHKNTKNIAKLEILPNTCLYNIFETYFSYRGYLLAENLQIYLETPSLKRANNVPKLPGVDYVAKTGH